MGGNLPEDPVCFLKNRKIIFTHVPIQQKKTDGRNNKRFSAFGFEAGLLKFNAHFPTGGNMAFVTQFYTTVLVKT